MSSYFTALLPIRRLFFLSHVQFQLFWITVFVNMVIRPSNSCFCLYTEEPCLATTPFIRPPLASAHIPWSFHADVKISESFYYFEASLMRTPRHYDQDFMAQRWSHQRGSTVFFLISVFHIVEQKTKTKMCVSWTTEINVKNENLGPAYMKKICFEQKGHPPIRASLEEATFHTFPYKTWRTV